MRSRRRPFPSTLKLFYIFGLVYFSSWLLSVSIFEFQLKSSRRINSSSKTQHQYPNNECKDFKPANAKDGSAFVNDNGRLTSSESWELLQSKRSMNGSHKKLTYLTMYGDHRAKDSFQLLPVWLQQYIKWNLRQVESISANATHEASTNSDTKYLVITCLPKDSACGGLSDRLRILPFYLLAAKLTSRLLCIYWEKPFPLEEYLQPTKYGIQWICPPEFGSLIDKSKSSARQIRRRKRKRRNMIDFHPWHRCHYTSLIQCTEEGIQNIKANDAKYIIIDMDSHSYHHINEMNLIFQRHSYYFSNRKEMPNLQQWSYPFEMGDIFRVLFKPLPILAQRVNRTMTKLGLVEKEYVSVHVRSRYPVEDVALVRERIDAIDKEGQLIFDCEGDRGDHDDRCYCTKSSSSSSLVQKRGGDTTTKYLIDVVTNAIRCGETFLHSNQKSNKIYFASDHHNITKFAVSNQFLVPSYSSRSLFHPHSGTQQYYIQPVGIVRDQMPLHFEVKHSKTLQPRHFDPVFEDLLIMGGSSCVSYGIGSYGSFGAALATQTCKAIHRRFDGAIVQCPNNRSDTEYIPVNSNEMLFRGR